jgi:hypothetical protein
VVFCYRVIRAVAAGRFESLNDRHFVKRRVLDPPDIFGNGPCIPAALTLTVKTLFSTMSLE